VLLCAPSSPFCAPSGFAARAVLIPEPLMELTIQRLSQAGVLDATRQWRNAATNLRHAATGGHLNPSQQATLMREAEAADRQADWWSDCHAQGYPACSTSPALAPHP